MNQNQSNPELLLTLDRKPHLQTIVRNTGSFLLNCQSLGYHNYDRF